MKVYVVIEDFDHYASEIVAVYLRAESAEDRLAYEDSIGRSRCRCVEMEVDE